MAKTLQDYSTNADSNLALATASGPDIPLGENQMLPRHVNDAVRAVMADAAIDLRASGRPARSAETFAVKIVDNNTAIGSRPAVGGKKIELDGQVNPFVVFNGVTGAPVTYTFDTSDGSNTAALRFYASSDQTTEHTAGVTVTGTPGTAGSNTQITVTEATPRILFYQIAGTSGLGGVAISAASSEALANVTAAVTQAQTAATNAFDSAYIAGANPTSNAEYFAQQASGSATSATTSATTATNAAYKSGATPTSNAEYFKEQAEIFKNQAYNYTYKAGATPTTNAEYYAEQAALALTDAQTARDHANQARDLALAADDNNMWLGGYAAGAFPTSVGGVPVVTGTALYDTTNGKIKVYNGSSYEDLAGSMASTSLTDTANIVYKDATLNELTGHAQSGGNPRFDH